MVDKPTPRRWFRFSLRTLFLIVTILCVWIGYQLNWIRQRHAYFQRPFRTFSDREVLTKSEAPFPLGLFGEYGIVQIWVHTDEEKRIAKKLFPEAKISLMP